MKILIVAGDNDLSNLGDNAMLVVTARRLNELIPDLRAYVVTRRPDRLTALLPGASPVLLDHPAPTTGPGRLLRRFTLLRTIVRSRRYRSWTSRVVPVLDEMDAVVLSGQGVMTDAFSHEAVWRLELLERARHLGKRTGLFSQGIGQVTRHHLIASMQQVLPKMDLITLRSPLSAQFLTSTIGCKPELLREGGDDGLAYPQIDSASEDAGHIGVSLRVADYAGSISSHVLNGLRDGLEQATEQLGVGLLPVPIEADDAAAVGTMLRLNLPSGNEIGLEILMDRIERCRMVVAGSYHSAVFALALGKPAICLAFSEYYRSKFVGLLEHFKDGCMLVEPGTFSPRDFREALTALWINAPDLSQGIQSTAEQLIELNRGHYREFAAMLQE